MLEELEEEDGVLDELEEEEEEEGVLVELEEVVGVLEELEEEEDGVLEELEEEVGVLEELDEEVLEDDEELDVDELDEDEEDLVVGHVVVLDVHGVVGEHLLSITLNGIYLQLRKLHSSHEFDP